VIGLSLSSLTIADALSEFGLHVIIFDKNRQEPKYRD
jgi:UDP-N-acetylmuramoylalanine-D-glutamate ligase